MGSREVPPRGCRAFAAAKPPKAQPTITIRCLEIDELLLLMGFTLGLRCAVKDRGRLSES
jgi:hypothetical protein